MVKFHINKHGEPAICKAKDGCCPLKAPHYDTKVEAKNAADKLNEEQYGILPENKHNNTSKNANRKRIPVAQNKNGIPVMNKKIVKDKKKYEPKIEDPQVPTTNEPKIEDPQVPTTNEPKIEDPQVPTTNEPKVEASQVQVANKVAEPVRRVGKPRPEKEYRKARSGKDLEYVKNRLEELKGTKKSSFYHRCRSSEKNFDFVPKLHSKTKHFSHERKSRSQQIKETFGKGRVIGFYKANQAVGLKDRVFKDQMVEIRDNGCMSIYDIDSGKKITTFIAPSTRIELVMLRAGDIPKESLLERIEKNKIIAGEKGINK